MSYCSSLNDSQVISVLNAERSRMRRHPEGEIHDGAKELYQEAREELLRRGMEPHLVLLDQELNDDETE